MNISQKYLNDAYLYILLLIPGTCCCAGIFYTWGNIAGLYHTSWPLILLFDSSQILYLTISFLFIHKKKKLSYFTEKDIFKIKLFITISLFIQYNFILYAFPCYNTWSCTFIFLGIVTFLFDTKLMLTHISGYAIFQIVAHILQFEQLVPTALNETNKTLTYRIIVYLLTSTSFFLITFFVQHFLVEEQEQEKENVYLMEKQLEYYQNCDLMDNELRKFRHDIKEHFMVMKYLADNKDYTEFNHYFAELTDSFAFQEKLYFSGNLIIDSILNHDITTKCGSHVKWTVFGKLTDIHTVSSIDLCTLFSNMLSNAINAVNLCSLEDSPQLSVGLDYGSKYFSITVTNSIPTENTDFKVKKNARALDRNHGHGMHKMIGICEKYNGEFNQTLKDGKMITTAYLPC